MEPSSYSYVAEEVRLISPNSLVLNLGLFTSVYGILKIMEFVLLLVAWGLMANFQGYYSFPATIFFMIVTVTAWIYVILVVITLMCNFQRRAKSAWPYLCVFFDLTFAASLIAASGLVTHLARILSDQSIVPLFCQYIIVITSCDRIYASIAFGFAAAIVFIFDAIFHHKEYQSTYVTHAHYSKY